MCLDRSVSGPKTSDILHIILPTQKITLHPLIAFIDFAVEKAS